MEGDWGYGSIFEMRVGRNDGVGLEMRGAIPFTNYRNYFDVHILVSDHLAVV